MSHPPRGGDGDGHPPKGREMLQSCVTTSKALVTSVHDSKQIVQRDSRGRRWPPTYWQWPPTLVNVICLGQIVKSQGGIERQGRIHQGLDKDVLMVGSKTLTET